MSKPEMYNSFILLTCLKNALVVTGSLSNFTRLVSFRETANFLDLPAIK